MLLPDGGACPPAPVSRIGAPQGAPTTCHSLISTNIVPITREDPGFWEKKVHHSAPRTPGSPYPPGCSDPGRITRRPGTIRHRSRPSRESDSHRSLDGHPTVKPAVSPALLWGQCVPGLNVRVSPGMRLPPASASGADVTADAACPRVPVIVDRYLAHNEVTTHSDRDADPDTRIAAFARSSVPCSARTG